MESARQRKNLSGSTALGHDCLLLCRPLQFFSLRALFRPLRAPDIGVTGKILQFDSFDPKDITKEKLNLSNAKMKGLMVALTLPARPTILAVSPAQVLFRTPTIAVQ